MTTPASFAISTADGGRVEIGGTDVSRVVSAVGFDLAAGEGARLTLDLAPGLLGTVTGVAQIDARLSPDDEAVRRREAYAAVEAEIRSLDPRSIAAEVAARSGSMGDDPAAVMLTVIADLFHDAVERAEEGEPEPAPVPS